ncbi:hypothetical protein NP233_g1410 [Leucocoprinus birnbaumii]|uniref:Uncharacterized protein n=1 Tax=Leucocoprinus birnbaumii TaxID=56174 RepID=A0AAD5YXZ8_9AGAR|nr:hypothetical protein NP233_g1410 [Leucocoprinus birnbaumii]
MAVTLENAAAPAITAHVNKRLAAGAFMAFGEASQGADADRIRISLSSPDGSDLGSEKGDCRQNGKDVLHV